MRQWPHSGFQASFERKSERDDRKGREGLLEYMDRPPVSLRDGGASGQGSSTPRTRRSGRPGTERRGKRLRRQAPESLGLRDQSRTYLVDPERCAGCGEPMKIVAALVSPHQDEAIEKIYQWTDDGPYGTSAK